MRKGATLVLDARAILFSDAIGGVERTMHLSDAAAMRGFTREVRGLRWTDPALTNLVRALVDEEDARLEQETPEFCRDAHAWAASGYKSIVVQTSHAAERFVAAQEVLIRELAKHRCGSPYPGRGVLHVLEETMSRGQRATAEDISRSETQVIGENAAIVRNAIAQIEKVLGTRLQLQRATIPPSDGVPVCVAVPRTGQRQGSRPKIERE